jgi:hypothetical protein
MKLLKAVNFLVLVRTKIHIILNKKSRSGGIAKMANLSLFCHGDPGSNFSIEKIFSDYVCIMLEFKSVWL